MLRQMEANYAAEGKPERAINFFHRGTSDVAAPIDDKVAAGWMRDVLFDADGAAGERADGPGLYVLIGWTDRARSYILKDELRYLSPEFVTESIDKNTGTPQGPKLLGAALLNDPFLTELPRVAASENLGDDMNRKLVCQALGCPESATDDEINSAAKKLTEEAAKSKEAEAAKAKEEEAAKEESAKKAAEGEAAKLALAESEKGRTSMAERVALLEGENAKLLAELKASNVKYFFDELVRGGRCTPALRTGLEAIAMKDGLEAVQFLAKAAPMVQMGEVGVTGEAGTTDETKAAEKRINDRIAELQGKGMKFAEALASARAELDADFRAVFGKTALAEHLVAKGIKV